MGFALPSTGAGCERRAGCERGAAPGSPCPETPAGAPSIAALQRRSNSPSMPLSSNICNTTALSSPLMAIQTVHRVPHGADFYLHCCYLPPLLCCPPRLYSPCPANAAEHLLDHPFPCLCPQHRSLLLSENRVYEGAGCAERCPITRTASGCANMRLRGHA